MDPLLQDLRYAARSLTRTPSFTAVAVFVLALGIGANTAIFAVVDATLLKPMPYPEADRVVRISASHPQAFVWFNPRGFETWPAFQRVRAFSAVGAYEIGGANLGGDSAQRVRATAVTAEFFDVLGARPMLGPLWSIRETYIKDRRFVMTMMSAFGGLAFALAALGLYGIIGYLVQLRTREIGIRMALGASISSVQTNILRSGVALALAGIGLGGAVAVGLSRLLSSTLRNFGQVDFVSLSLLSVAVIVVAAIAAWFPARRATLIDPVKALRFE